MERDLSSPTPVHTSFAWDSDAVLDQADVAIYAVDAEGRCIRYNQAAERLLGYTRQEALGRDMHELIHNRYPDGRPFPVSECALMHARTASSTLTNLAEVLWTKSGEPIHAECSAAPLHGDGTGSGAVVTIKDVRDRREAEERHRASLKEQTEALRQRDAAARIEREQAAADSQRQRDLSFSVERAAAEQLQNQQELISTVAEMAPVGIAVMDGNMRYRWHNRCYQDFLNVLDRRETEKSGTLAPGSGSPIEPVLQDVRSGGKSYSADDFRITAQDGSLRYWRWSATRNSSSDDLIIVANDVTEQVSARQEIESIYATAPIALALVDAKDFRYLRVNEDQAAMLGVTPKDLIGKTVDEALGIKDMRRLFERASGGEVIAGETVSGTLPGQPKNVRHWFLNVVPNRDGDGRVATISVAGLEVTAQKRAEDALMEADKLAAVGRLVSSISHEINNPLEAVTNLLYLIHQDQDLSAEACEYVKMAEGEIARVSQIASQTLRFHRHAIGVVSLTPQQIVDPVVALYQGRLKNSHVQLKVEYADDKPVICREGDVRQILNNLVGNALDATGGGGSIKVRIRAAYCPKAGLPGTRISVSDSGHGIRPETAARIFEPFYTTKGASGSGLGLWISHSLAERQGGTLQVRSCPEGMRKSGESGTTFSLFLPHPAQ